MRLLILLALIASCAAIPGVGHTQSVAVVGKLTCHGAPASSIKVKLYEKEKLIDVKLDEGKTNQMGEFKLSGSKREVTTIDPKVNIYHKCNHRKPCYRKFGITIPDSYVTKGPHPKKTFDIGIINLENRFTGETIDCLN